MEENLLKVKPDNGSEINLITYKKAKELNLKIKTNTNIILKALWNKNIFKPIGTTNARVYSSDLKISKWAKLIIVDLNINCDLLFGLPLMKSFNCKLEFQKNYSNINNKEINTINIYDNNDLKKLNLIKENNLKESNLKENNLKEKII